MSFDGFFLHHLTKELKESLLYGRIQKVNQPFERELVLTIRNHRQNYKLLLSAHPVFGRVQITQADFQNPQVPNTFTMIMRKYLQGAVIEQLEQIENDRIIELKVSNKNEIGDAIQTTLIIEIMGKHSNIILVDRSENKIIESIKHVGFSQNSYRTISQALPILSLLKQVLSILLQFLMCLYLKFFKHKTYLLKAYNTIFKA